MNAKINLYDEIVEVLKENYRVPKDILWIGTKDATIDRADFLDRAKKTDYDNGYGGSVIARDLIIVGDDWWLTRGEYDGREWWDFNTYPQRPRMRKTKFDIRVYALFERFYT